MEIFDIYGSRLYQSGHIDDWGSTREKNIDTIIDLSGDIDPYLRLGLPSWIKTYVYHPIEDDIVLPDMNKMRVLAEFVDNLLYHTTAIVLIHCAAGINRSSLLNGIILSSFLGITEPVEYIRMKRPGALTNLVFEEYLRGL